MARGIRADRTRPRWVLLYALLPLCAALLALAESIPSTGGLRTLAEIAVVLLVIGLAALWVRGNRRALARLPVGSGDGTESRGMSVQVKHSSPRVIQLDPRCKRPEG